MNNFDSIRAITRRHFWDDYRSPLTCVVIPSASGSGSGETIDIGITPVFQGVGPDLTAVAAGGSITLSWSQTPKAYAYVIYRANVAGGPFTILLAGLVARSYVDIPAISGTYYYRVTAIEPDFGETLASNTASATV
jgi:hypothetical protein